MSRSFLACLDWLLCGLFWIGFLIALPGTIIAHLAHHGGIMLAERRFR